MEFLLFSNWKRVTRFDHLLDQEIMEDPVLVPESGNTYERANIENWLQHSM